MAIFFTSDLHLGHKKVIEFNERPFSSIEEMNETLIEKYNERVSPNDTVYLLGDISYRVGRTVAENMIRRLNGKKILIRGNHDAAYADDLFEGIYDYHVIEESGMWIVLMHYPLLEWYKSREKESIHLHGHIHSKKEYNRINQKYGVLRYDVGVDANDFYPLSLDEIFHFFKETLEDKS